MGRWIFTAISLVILVEPAQATPRVFGDLSASSGDGRFLVEARLVDGEGQRWNLPAQPHFRYRLFNKDTDRELWSREQPIRGERRVEPSEGPPTALYVSDQGWTVIRTAEAWGKPIELIAVNPKGEDKIRVSLFKSLALEGEDVLRYVRMSTAGIVWGPAYFHFYFTSIDGTPHFCVRSWWGKRAVLDLVRGTQVTCTPEIEQHCYSLEKKFVLETLKSAQRWMWVLSEDGSLVLSSDSNVPTLSQGLLAIHMAGKIGLTESEPLLRVQESCLHVGSTASTGGPYTADPGEVKPYWWRNFTIRQLVQLSLRRLGCQPAGYQATQLHRVGDGYWFPDDPLAYSREERASEISQGLTPEEVLDKIGAPDFVDFGTWEYDMDGDDPYTLMLSWDASGVAKIIRHDPPKWRDDITRDQEFVF
jgi:hypothetical protein